MDVNCSSRAPLPEGPFDVVVIGGGIHGVAVARQCALAGKSTLLLEQHDFGAGTTSRSPRTIGDVLSDLERGDFATVREALRERDNLLLERGHLVRHVTGLVALGPERRRSALEVRFGLWLRRKLGQVSLSPEAEAQAQSLQNLLGPDAGWTVLPFDDAICEFPERLVAEWLREALEAGALARNHCRVLELKIAGGKVRGVVLRDLLGRREQLIAARWVIDATGPSIGHLAQQSGIGSDPAVVTVRNSYLVLRSFAGAPNASVYGEGVYGRPVSLVPCNGYLIFGPSEVLKKNSFAAPQPGNVELEYIEASFRKLFPHVEPEIVAAFAGDSAVARQRGFGGKFMQNRSLVIDYADQGARGLLGVIGGALTTVSSTVRDCAAHLGFSLSPSPEREFLPNRRSGVEQALHQWARAVSGSAGIPEQTAHAIAGWYGRHALGIARLAQRDESLRAPLCPHAHHIVAEAVDAVRHEGAVLLADILLRRVPVASGACWSPECTGIAAQRIGRALGWSPAEMLRQAMNFEAERAAFLVPPQPRHHPPSPRIPDTLAA